MTIAFAETFVLIRDTDVTGVSGTGVVADGVLWPDGTVSIRWRGEQPSVVFWDNGMDAVRQVHGHGGATRAVFPAGDSDTVRELPGAGWTARGFATFTEFQDGRGTRVRVAESSAADGRCVWIFVGSDAAAHLSEDDAGVVCDALSQFVRGHQPLGGAD